MHSLPRYEPQSIVVKVTDGAAVSINFTLTPDHRQEWSDTNDFGIAVNVAGTKFLNNDELQTVFTDLASKYPSISTVDTSHLTHQVELWVEHTSECIGVACQRSCVGVDMFLCCGYRFVGLSSVCFVVACMCFVPGYAFFFYQNLLFTLYPSSILRILHHLLGCCIVL